MQRTLLAIMLAATITLAGCTSDSTDDSQEIDNDGESVPSFPVWSEITDDNTTWVRLLLIGYGYSISVRWQRLASYRVRWQRLEARSCASIEGSMRSNR